MIGLAAFAALGTILFYLFHMQMYADLRSEETYEGVRLELCFALVCSYLLVWAAWFITFFVLAALE